MCMCGLSTKNTGLRFLARSEWYVHTVYVNTALHYLSHIGAAYIVSGHSI